MNLSEIHAAGGWFMIPIDFIAIINVGLIAYILYAFISKKNGLDSSLQFLKQLGLLSLGWGVFGTILGLFAAFNALEQLKDPLPFNIISGGLKVSLLTVLYGFIVYLISMGVYLIFKLAGKMKTQAAN
jgi:biopolymer transport protein ExbB/TolQ